MSKTAGTPQSDIEELRRRHMERMSRRYWTRRHAEDDHDAPEAACAKCGATSWQPAGSNADWYCFRCGARGSYSDEGFVQNAR